MRSYYGRQRVTADPPQAAKALPAAENEQPAARMPTGGGSALTPAMVIALQRAAGNATVVQLLKQRGHNSSASQSHQAPAPSNHTPTLQRSSVDDVLSSPGRPLAQPVRAEMEARLGANFETVRVHDDASAARSAVEIDSRAYTSNEHIVIGPGGGDKHTLAHELTHVIQQRSGPVAGTATSGGFSISDPSDRFERAAEANATRVMSRAADQEQHTHGSGCGHEPSGSTVQRATSGEPVVQRAWTQGTMAGDDPVYTTSGGRSGVAEVHNLHGTALDEGANAPGASAASQPIGWTQLGADGLVLGGQMPPANHYNAVRMHLWNGRLGGPGNDIRNLAPGPSQLNSAMSAGPETAAKNLVDAGNQVWLRTTVTYQNSPANALDYLSVVPNRIVMEWGVEGDASTNRSWPQDVRLPVDPLQGADANAYRLWAHTGADLVLDLAGKSDQIRAQVLTLVPTFALKQAVLEGYPHLFRAMAVTEKGNFLGALSTTSLATVTTFLTAIGIRADELVPHAIGPLDARGFTAIVGNLFVTYIPNKAVQRDILFAYRTPLVEMLGNPIKPLAKLDYPIFQLYSEGGRARLMAEMAPLSIVMGIFLGMLNKTQRAKELDNWARNVGHATPGARYDFIAGHKSIDEEYLKEYRKVTVGQASSEEYKSKRPSRH